MTQEELKQRLIELIEQPMPMMCGTVTYGEMRMPEYQARFIVNNLIANGVTIQKNAYWKTREDKNDYLWVECSNCGFMVENYKAVELGCHSTDIISYKYHSCPICTAKMVLPSKEGV